MNKKRITVATVVSIKAFYRTTRETMTKLKVHNTSVYNDFLYILDNHYESV